MKTILAVDDSSSIREVIKFILEDNGYNPILAVDGIDAINKLNENENIDLILTDLNMPNMDGIGVVRETRKIESYKNKPILILTTETNKEKKMEAKEAGATGWLVKPFENNKLIKVIQKVLR